MVLVLIAVIVGGGIGTVDDLNGNIRMVKRPRQGRVRHTAHHRDEHYKTDQPADHAGLITCWLAWNNGGNIILP